MYRILIYFLLQTQCVLQVSSQITEWIGTDLDNSTVRSVQIVDSNTVVTVTNADNKSQYASYLNFYHLEPPQNGSSIIQMTLVESIIYSDSFYTHTAKFIEQTESWLVVQSRSMSFLDRIYRIILYNRDFEKVTETSVTAIGRPQMFHIESDENYTYVLASLIPNPYNQIIYLKYDHHEAEILPDIFVGQTHPQPIIYLTSLEIDHETGNLLLFSYSGAGIVTPDLEIVELLTPFELKIGDIGNIKRTDNYYFLHGSFENTMSDKGYRNTVIRKFDLNFNAIHSDTLGGWNHDNTAFLVKSLQIKDEEVVVGGHLAGLYSHNPFDESIKKFYLAKYDKDLNQIWRKEYGGDRAYFILGLSTLTNKDMVVYGAITDPKTGARSAYLMYVNKNGEFVSSFQEPIPSNPISLQNICQNTVNINSQSEEKLIISFFSSNGVHVKQSLINFGSNIIGLAELPNALYYYVVYNENGIISNGKLVKID